MVRPHQTLFLTWAAPIDSRASSQFSGTRVWPRSSRSADLEARALLKRAIRSIRAAWPDLVSPDVRLRQFVAFTAFQTLVRTQGEPWLDLSYTVSGPVARTTVGLLGFCLRSSAEGYSAQGDGARARDFLALADMIDRLGPQRPAF